MATSFLKFSVSYKGKQFLGFVQAASYEQALNRAAKNWPDYRLELDRVGGRALTAAETVAMNRDENRKRGRYAAA